MSKLNKICFVGAQGTGKTTVLNALREDPDFKGFTFYTEIVRKLAAEKGLKINEEGTAETQKVLFDTYSEILDKMLNEKAVSDRCIIDVSAYTAFLNDHLEEPDADLSEEDFRERKELLRRKYELGTVAYFPIEFPVVEDGVRSPSETFRISVDQKIKQYLTNYRFKFITVTGTVEERVKTIKKAMGLIE